MAAGGRDLSLLFDWLEYTVFFLSLAISLVVGIYYGFFKKQGQNTKEGYVLGQKQIKLLPMATSLVASFISGIALLGLGAETYKYGTQYFISNVTIFVVVLINIMFFLPVLYKLQVISVYEYVERRFDRRIRKAASLIFAFYLVTYIPVVIYAPALALNQVAKINIHLITPVVCSICIFYTSIGGLKAVVLTDMLQTFIMIGSMVTVVVFGLSYTGSLSNALNIVEAGERWEWFNLDPHPSTRISFWSATVGMGIYWTAETSINPAFVQRFIALPTEATAKKAAVWMAVGSTFFRTLAGIIGLLAYTKYHGCDPISAKIVNKPDQIPPYFVLDVAGHLRGLPGLYMSGIFAAALSTMSTGLNTIAATVYEDLVLPFMKQQPSEEKASRLMKLLSVLFGIICVCLIYLVEKLGSVLEMSISLGGASCGVLLTIFVTGMFVPFGNTKGVAFGGAAGMIFGAWIITGAKMAHIKGLIAYPEKPISVADCPGNITLIMRNSSQINLSAAEEVFPVFKLSPFYYGAAVFLFSVTVSILVSWFTGGNKGKLLDPNLFSPYVHKYLNKGENDSSQQKVVGFDENHLYIGVPTKDVEVEMNEINKTSSS